MQNRAAVLTRLLEICVCAALLVLPGRFACAADFLSVVSVLEKQGFYVESFKTDGEMQILEVVSKRGGERASIQIGRYANERDAKARFETIKPFGEKPEKPPFQAGDGIIWVSSPRHWAFCTTFGRVFLLINASGMPQEVAKELAIGFEKLFTAEARIRSSEQ